MDFKIHSSRTGIRGLSLGVMALNRVNRVLAVLQNRIPGPARIREPDSPLRERRMACSNRWEQFWQQLDQQGY